MIEEELITHDRKTALRELRQWLDDELAEPTPDPYACLNCGATMQEEHAHYRCTVCGFVDGCCEGRWQG